MRLPFQLPFGKKEKKEFYLALLLQDESVGAVIFEKKEGTLFVLAHCEEQFPTNLLEASFEELLETIDKAVSTAEESLPDGQSVNQTIFGVKQDWIDDGKIKKDYLVVLKKVCDELALEPMGFLVFTEAILHALQKEEGAPVSAILVEIGKKFIVLSLVRAGRIITTKRVHYKTPITTTVDDALKEFDIEILPARIIFFDGENKEKLTQQFISHSWSKSLPFLHVPQITVLPPGFETKGILFGTATQMGLQIMLDGAVPQKRVRLEENIEELAPIKTPDKHPEEKTNEMDEPIKEDTKEVVAGDNFDFVTEPPIDESTEELEKEETIDTSVNADYFGFVKNKDVTDTTPHTQKFKQIEEKEENIPRDVMHQAIEEIPEEVKEKETDTNKGDQFAAQSTQLFAGIKKGFASLSNIFGTLKKNMETDQPHSPKQDQGKKLQGINKTFIVIPLVLLVLVLCIVGYIFGISATVTLHITPKIIQDQQTVTLTADAETNLAKQTIKSETVSTDEEGTLSADTTGTKQVGTPAKGQVTIFSRLTDTTTIAKGTTLTASNGLAFTFDNTVNVASFSGDTTDPSVTVANIPITSKDIGPEYNLPSGTKFTINGLAKGEISAKNDAAFSGGTKKDVTVVAQKDVDNLLANLTKNLSDKAKSDMTSKVGGTKQLLPFFTKQDVTKKTLNHQVGDEAKNVSIDATITYDSLTVDKNELTTFATQSLKDKLPADANLGGKGIQSDISDIKQDKNTVTGTITMKANLLPTINTSDLSKQLAGKSFDQAGSILKNISQVESVEMVLQPPLPFLPKVLPRLGNHITILIVSND